MARSAASPAWRHRVTVPASASSVGTGALHAAQWISSPSNVKTHPAPWRNKAPCIRRDRLEHRLYVALRLADHAQDLAGCGLLLEGLGKVRLRVSSSVNSRVFSTAITA